MRKDHAYSIMHNRVRSVLGIAFVMMLSAGALPAQDLPGRKGGDGTFRVILLGEPTSLNPDLRADDPSTYRSE